MQAPEPQDRSSSASSQAARRTARLADPSAVSDRDGNWNGYSIEKLQYQKNIDPHSYLRALDLRRVLELVHQRPAERAARLRLGSCRLRGFRARLRRQPDLRQSALARRICITAEASYMTQRLQTYDAAFSSTDPFTTSLAPTGLGTILSSYGTPNGKCYNYSTGQPWSCFDAGSQGGCLTPSGCYPGEGSYNFNLTPGRCAARVACRQGRRALDDDRERPERAGR